MILHGARNYRGSTRTKKIKGKDVAIDVDIPCPISISEIKAYLDFKGVLESDEREEFFVLVMALDRAMINHRAEALA